MNVEITKYKNSSSDALKNRLLRLEKILQQLLKLSGNIILNNSVSATGGNSTSNNAQGNSLAELALSSIGMEKSGNVNQSPLMPIRPTMNTPKSARNGLLLSHGQIIAELASAIARAGHRNS